VKVSTGGPVLSAQFEVFVARSIECLRTSRLSATMPDPSAAFEEFVESAWPLVATEVRRRCSRSAGALASVVPWLLPDGWDLLRIAGFAFVEDAYTELLAWTLNPETHPPTALRRQNAWLSSFRFQPKPRAARAVTPITQLRTDGGIPDLVLRYDDFVLVVEAKTGTEEHETSTGELQTLAYVPAVRRRLAVPDAVPLKVVFLTPDGRAAANPAAVSATYADFVAAFAREMRPAEFPEDLRTLLGLVLTHLITCAGIASLNVTAIRHAAEWSADLSWTEDREIAIRRMLAIDEVLDALAREAHDVE
jgi:hypothetical protein